MQSKHTISQNTSKYDRPWKENLNMEDNINDFVGHTVIHFLEDWLCTFATCITHSTNN